MVAPLMTKTIAPTSQETCSAKPKMEKLHKNISLPSFLLTSLITYQIAAAADTLNTSQTIADGETMVSSNGMFEVGFFSPGNPENRYVGMWYKNITPTTVIWVANRERPLRNKSGVLKVTEPGVLVILNDTNGIIIWSSNRSTSSVQNPVAQLLDYGNLVVKDANDDRMSGNNDFLWQSFDYPTDTLIPGMSLGWNFVTGVETYTSSWKSGFDPSPGDFTLHLDPTGYPQMVLKRGNIVQSRIGPWNGIQFSGARNQNENRIYRLTVTINENEVKYRLDTDSRSVISRSTVSQNGVVQRWSWNYQTQAWGVYVSLPGDNCDTYGMCGPHGSCNIRISASCECLDYRFVPRDSEAWLRGEWLSGCVRRTNLSCRGDVFLKYSGLKMPDARNSWFNESMTLRKCREECLRNCSCMAYTQLDIREGSGCLFYSGDLVDIRDVSPGGQDIYIRMASSELESKGKKRVILIASITSTAGVVLLCLTLILYMQKRKKDQNMRKGIYDGSHGRDSQLPFFKLSTIMKATAHFSDENKLGEGGFGPVYKGLLENGEEIAVKRLSKTSGQGVEEMKNEVILIANLQHRNLVRLLGCCIKRDENMLVYEYMPNNSLDLILFDQTKSKLLDWPKRFNIINGIAKGLMYLHQDSRLRIIHRDLKASNILLDSEMNPKISDFGLARCFGGNETEAKTRRIIGTYGYMSPEYAIDGLFSIKSDVFSFGVLVLEVVTGKRNRGFHLNDQNLNLLGHAWQLHKEENSLKLVDASLGDSFDTSEVLRSIQVGLLCVQKRPEDRPTMSSVVSMLGNDVALPQAKQPGFFTERDVSAAESSSNTNTGNSASEITITWSGGR